MSADRWLRIARAAAGLSQRDLAQAAQVPQPSIARVERGQQVPRVDTLLRMLEASGFELELRPRVDPDLDYSQVRFFAGLTPEQRLRTSVHRGQLNRLLHVGALSHLPEPSPQGVPEVSPDDVPGAVVRELRLVSNQTDSELEASFDPGSEGSEPGDEHFHDDEALVAVETTPFDGALEEQPALAQIQAVVPDEPPDRQLATPPVEEPQSSDVLIQTGPVVSQEGDRGDTWAELHPSEMPITADFDLSPVVFGVTDEQGQYLSSGEWEWEEVTIDHSMLDRAISDAGSGSSHLGEPPKESQD